MIQGRLFHGDNVESGAVKESVAAAAEWRILNPQLPVCTQKQIWFGNQFTDEILTDDF